MQNLGFAPEFYLSIFVRLSIEFYSYIVSSRLRLHIGFIWPRSRHSALVLELSWDRPESPIIPTTKKDPHAHITLQNQAMAQTECLPSNPLVL